MHHHFHGHKIHFEYMNGITKTRPWRGKKMCVSENSNFIAEDQLLLYTQAVTFALPIKSSSFFMSG